MPGVLLLTELLRLVEREFGPQVKILSLSQVKFAAPLRPGEEVTITVEKGRDVAFRILREGTVIASGTLHYAAAPEEGRPA